MNNNEIITEKAKAIAVQINKTLRSNSTIEYNTQGDIVKLFRTYQIPYPWDIVVALVKAGCLVKQVNKDAKVVYKFISEKPAYYKIIEDVLMFWRDHNKKYHSKNKSKKEEAEDVKEDNQKLKRNCEKSNKDLEDLYREALVSIGYDFESRTFSLHYMLDNYIEHKGDRAIIEYIKSRGYKIMKPVKYEEV